MPKYTVFEYVAECLSFILNNFLVCFRLRCHYENTPMQYTAIFHGCENVNFQMKNYDIFLFFSKHRFWVHVRTASSGGSNVYPQSIFMAKIRKHVYLCTSQFYYIKVGCKGVYITRTCYNDGVAHWVNLD